MGHPRNTFRPAQRGKHHPPGPPNASETCYHVGYVHAGYPGLLVAGISFILPAIISALILAWVYMRYGALPEMVGAVLLPQSTGFSHRA